MTGECWQQGCDHHGRTLLTNFHYKKYLSVEKHLITSSSLILCLICSSSMAGHGPPGTNTGPGQAKLSSTLPSHNRDININFCFYCDTFQLPVLRNNRDSVSWLFLIWSRKVKVGHWVTDICPYFVKYVFMARYVTWR